MMQFILATAIGACLGYLLGSCNAAIIVVRLLKGEDIRDHGSHNAGLTNTLRCFGKGAAALTLIFDLTKGVVAVLLSSLFCNLLGAGLPFPDGDNVRYISFVAGIFAILGHVFPLYYGFKGGKGVLVGVSIFLVLCPLCFVSLIAVFALILWRSRYVSLASIIATACAPVFIGLYSVFLYHEPVSFSLIYAGLTAVMAAIIIIKHHENIHRLRTGTENRFSFSKKKDTPTDATEKER